jgi:hypothetical protein
MALSSLLLLGQLASTLPLVGLIWTIQIVHYPLFGAVGEPGFVGYHARHSTRISMVVIPLMLVELATTIGRVVVGNGSLLGLIPVAVVWASTFLISVPLHGRLGTGFDPRAHRALVVTNWIRTAAWTAHGVMVLVAVAPHA